MLGIILCLPFNDHDEDDDERDFVEGMFENFSNKSILWFLFGLGQL